MITDGAMKTFQLTDHIVWKHECHCHGDFDIMRVCLDRDKDDENKLFMIDLTFSKRVVANDYIYPDRWIGRMWWRIKAAIKILWSGYIEMDNEHIIATKGKLDSLIEFLQEARMEWDKMESNG